VIVVLAGSTSTETRAAAGTISRQELQPLRYQLSRENIDPRQVAAGPGKAGDKTESLTGSSPATKTIGIVAVAAFTANVED
jgi:hypothetical protein